MLQTNDSKTVDLLTRYRAEFFALIPQTNPDVIKLISDERGLREKYRLDLIDFNLLDARLYDAFSEVSRYIASLQSLNTKEPGNFGITPLMIHVSRHIPCGTSISSTLDELEKKISSLLASGADINAIDAYGRTALMYIVLGASILGHDTLPGRERFVRLLLNNGANPLVRDVYGKTALDHFRKHAGEDHPTVQLLEQAMQKRREHDQAKYLLTSGHPVFDTTPVIKEDINLQPSYLSHIPKIE